MQTDNTLQVKCELSKQNWQTKQRKLENNTCIKYCDIACLDGAASETTKQRNIVLNKAHTKRT